MQSATAPPPSSPSPKSQPIEAVPAQAAAGDAAAVPEGGADRGFRRGGGNAQQAANWLNTVSSGGRAAQLDTSLRPEEFTQQLESLQRQRGATIERAKGKVEGTGRRRFAADDYGLAQQQDEAQASMASERTVAAAAAAAAAGVALEGAEGQAGSAGQVDENVHNPAVATWGVYPRPKNISEACVSALPCVQKRGCSMGLEHWAARCAGRTVDAFFCVCVHRLGAVQVWGRAQPEARPAPGV